ncbi:MAG TPA: DMT family transporter [Candidatus Uhrbacteria bacterium]|nr:DMT family transporter [Candidatus Uhrbacteria bacterium]
MNKTKKGLYLVLVTALISGVAVFLSKFAVQSIGNSHVFTTGKNLLVGLILTALILTPFILPRLKKIKFNDWLKLILIGIIGGSVPFLLFFKAVSLASSSVSTAFIHKTLFVWVSLLAVWFLKEKIGKLQYLALALLFLGNFALLGFKFITFGYAEGLALIATLMWSVEFIIAKRVLQNVESEIVAWARMFFGSIILLGYIGYLGLLGDLVILNVNQWLWILLTSGLLLGYVLTWYKALKYLPAVTVTSVLVLASPLTTLLNGIFVTHKYDWGQIIGSVLIVFAGGLIIYSFKQVKNVTSSVRQFN